MSAFYHPNRQGIAVPRLLIVLAIVLLVAGPVLYRESQREVARWYLASAHEAMLDGDYRRALENLDRAIAWDDSSPLLLLQRAAVKDELQHWESGLEDCDRAAKLAADPVACALTRSSLLMRLHRFGEAIGQLKELLQEQTPVAPDQQAEWLNMLAYARALGDQELPQALEAINQALDIAATQIGMLDPLGFLAFHRAHTARTRGSDELVLASLELAEQSASRAYQDAALRLQVLSYLPRGAGEYAQRVQLLRSHLAGILDLRATVAEQADRAAEAARCRKRLTQLAPGGNISLAQPMDFSLAVRQLTSTSAMLDTRGMVQLRLGNLREARRDIDTSIAIAELLSQRFDWQIEARKHTLVDIREMELQRRDMQYTRAVIYYHRSLVHEALGMDKQAQLDRDKVVELGFQPSDRLL